MEKENIDVGIISEDMKNEKQIFDHLKNYLIDPLEFYPKDYLFKAQYDLALNLGNILKVRRRFIK